MYQMLKKLIIPLFAGVSLFFCIFAGMAVFASDAITVELDGKEIIYNNHTGFPFLDTADRTQVPLRKTMETFGASVDWDSQSQTATIVKDDTTVQVIFGRTYILVNGKNVPTDTEPLLIEDRTYLPIRAVAEAFGATVTWQDWSNTVQITRPVDPAQPEIGSTETILGKERTLTFYDDFNGTGLNGANWSPTPNWERGDIGAFWSDSMVRLDGDGHLILSVRKHTDGRYMSGAIRSKGKFEQAYGYFEIRCQLQNVPGFWGGFWLMGDGVYQVGDDGRDGTEIDIVESPFLEEETINQALHWDGYEADHQTVGKRTQIPGIYDGFHTFALEWEEDGYRFYVDGKKTWETNAGGVCAVPLYLKISTEVGTWAGTINDEALPAALIVDYVKVYQ